MKGKNQLSGPAMKARLKAFGIKAQRVIQRMNTGHYVADFYSPGMDEPVESSNTIAQSIQQHGLRVLKRNDTVADWREGKPIIWASVTFMIEEESA